jgi:hypothetical protein
MPESLIPPNGQPVTVFVAVPADDGHRLTFWRSLMDLMIAPEQNGVKYRIVPVPGDSLIPRIRNNLLWLWYTQTKDDFLLFLDTDLDFRVEDVHSLVAHRLPIVAGLYGKKQPEMGWVINALKGEPAFNIDGGIHRVACAGTGAFLVHRSVVDKMVSEATNWPHWKIRYIDDADKTERWHLFSHVVIDDPVEFPHSPRDMSEDWAFCYYARKLGFDVWLDTAAVFLHEGAALYPLQARRLSREEVTLQKINQPDGTVTPMHNTTPETIDKFEKV